jgi:hypothetical protein
MNILHIQLSLFPEIYIFAHSGFELSHQRSSLLHQALTPKSILQLSHMTLSIVNSADCEQEQPKIAMPQLDGSVSIYQARHSVFG